VWDWSWARLIVVVIIVIRIFWLIIKMVVVWIVFVVRGKIVVIVLIAETTYGLTWSTGSNSLKASFTNTRPSVSAQNFRIITNWNLFAHSL